MTNPEVASPSAALSAPPALPELMSEPTMERQSPRATLSSSDPLGDLVSHDPFEGPTAEVTKDLMLQLDGPTGPDLLTPPPGAAADVLEAVVEAAATLPPSLYNSDGPASSSLPFDEITRGADDLPAYSDDDNDPMQEKTADLEMPRRPGTSHDDKSAEADPGSQPPEDTGATVEGAPVVEDAGTDVGPLPPEPGQVMTADDGSAVRLEDSLGEQNGSVFYRARVDGEDQPYTAVWTATTTPEPPWSHLPDPRIVRPRCRITLERAAIRVFERPKGNTVVDYLNDDDRILPAMATLELGIELAELLESLHGAGQFVYDLDPSQIVIERGGRVRFYAVSGLYGAGTVPTGPLGLFAAPETRRRMTYRMGAHSDVFAVSLLLYALLAKRAPLDNDVEPQMLVSPRVFRPECPLGIWPYLRPCLEANPMRRVGYARALKKALEKARGRLIEEARAAEQQAEVILEGWAEQHTGLTKARRGSGQQDRALAVTDENARIGLYLIADGVSRSRFGDGAFAAEQVEVTALQRWSGLEKGGQAALELNHAQRTDIMKQIARSAGKRISAEVNAKHAPLANEPNQVMSSTMCAMFVVHGEATLGNLGDSRAYLIRDGVIEQITIDHDRCTDALRMGLTFREAAQVQMGTALTRVVGRVIIDDDGTSRPDPFEPETFRVRLLPGDRILIASDGVTDFAAGAGAPPAETDARMLEIVQEYEDPARAAFELVVAANRAGGFDNISCVVVAVHPVG
jgi:protein phosphatase